MNKRDPSGVTLTDVVVIGGLTITMFTVGFVSFEQYIDGVSRPSFLSRTYSQAPISKPEYTPYTDASTITLVTGVKYDTQLVKTDKVAPYSLPYKPKDKFDINPLGYSRSPSYAISRGVQLFKIDWENPEQVEYFSYKSEGASPEIRPVRLYSKFRRA